MFKLPFVSLLKVDGNSGKLLSPFTFSVKEQLGNAAKYLLICSMQEKSHDLKSRVRISRMDELSL